MIDFFCCGYFFWTPLFATITSAVYIRAKNSRGQRHIRVTHEQLGLHSPRKNRCWLQARLFYSQARHPTPIEIALHRRHPLWKLRGVKGHDGRCLSLRQSKRALRFARVTFGFLLSPKMPSCSSSLLARALSDTNTIGWHVGDGRGRRVGRRGGGS